MICAVTILSISCSLLAKTEVGVSENVVQKSVLAGESVVLKLDNGASINIPPNSLPVNTDVSIKISNEKTEVSAEYSPAGNLYEISFSGAVLNTPAELTLPYNTALLPETVTPDMLFIAYFDEQQRQWIFAGGEVDQSQQVIRLQTPHASRWSVFYWNWDAWIAVLNKSLEGNLASILEAVDLLTNDCPQKGASVSVVNIASQNLVQGCVESEEGSTAHVRVINPKSFFYEVKGNSSDRSVAFTKMLAPGEQYEFNIDTKNLSPLTVTAEITQEAGYRLVLHQFLLMMPGFSTLKNQPHTVACITERLHDVSYFASAAEALLEMDDLSGLAAGESISNFLYDESAVQRFLTSSYDCAPNLAKTWSHEGINILSNSTNVIISSVDYVANTLAMMFRGESSAKVDFQWDQMSVDLTNPQSVFNWLEHILKTGNVDLFNDLVIEDYFYYAYYLEGGQEISYDQFQQHLSERLSHQPACMGVNINDYSMFIWYDDWQPAWRMTEMCYAGCQTLSPPWESNTSAFMFGFKPESGEYYFRGMYQNTPDKFFFTDYLLKPCDSNQPLIAPTPVSRCPGSPAQRLVVGEQGKVCTKKDGVYLRINPGKQSETIALVNPGTTFTVVDGPECAGNNWSWWKVELNDGRLGWLAEGGDIYDPYFLCLVD